MKIELLTRALRKEYLLRREKFRGSDFFVGHFSPPIVVSIEGGAASISAAKALLAQQLIDCVRKGEPLPRVRRKRDVNCVTLCFSPEDIARVVTCFTNNETVPTTLFDKEEGVTDANA